MISNPLVVATSLKIAVFIVVIMAMVELVHRFWGQGGVLAVAGLSGIMDVDAITLSMARADRAAPLAMKAILLAVGVNTCAKAVMAAWVGGLGVGLRVGLASLVAVGMMTATYFLTA